VYQRKRRYFRVGIILVPFVSLYQNYSSICDWHEVLLSLSHQNRQHEILLTVATKHLKADIRRPSLVAMVFRNVWVAWSRIQPSYLCSKAPSFSTTYLRKLSKYSVIPCRLPFLTCGTYASTLTLQTQVKSVCATWLNKCFSPDIGNGFDNCKVDLRTRAISVYVFCAKHFVLLKITTGNRGSTVVKVLCYKSEGRWFDSRWCHWNFSLT